MSCSSISIANCPNLGYRCIGIDTGGFGKSDNPWRGYEYDRLADDLLAIIKELELKILLCWATP